MFNNGKKGTLYNNNINWIVSTTSISSIKSCQHRGWKNLRHFHTFTTFKKIRTNKKKGRKLFTNNIKYTFISVSHTCNIWIRIRKYNIAVQAKPHSCWPNRSTLDSSTLLSPPPQQFKKILLLLLKSFSHTIFFNTSTENPYLLQSHMSA